MPRVLVLQHTAPETLGIITDALQARGISAQYIRTFQEESVPKEMDGAEGLVILGGPMAVRDQTKYPFLQDEMRLIEQALRADKPILGVCLGSQLLASVLGARVSLGKKKEIGWHPVRLSEEAGRDPLWKGADPSFMAYHWHGDVFDLPQGAISLASSEATQHQAFGYQGKAYGFLFHLELTENMIREMIRTFSDVLLEQNIDAGWVIEKGNDHLPPLGKIGKRVFERWADLIK